VIELSQNKALLGSAELELSDAKTHFDRMLSLWENKSISLKQFEEAKSRYERAKLQSYGADVSVKRAQHMLDEAAVKAPFDGIVSNCFVDKGTMVSPMTQLIEVQTVDPLTLEFSLPQVYLNKVHEGMLITFEVDGCSQGKQHAQIDKIFPSLDEGTRSFICRAKVANKENQFSPGSMATVEVELP